MLVSPSPFGSFHNLPPKTKNALILLTENKDRKYNFCGTTLFAGKPATSITVPTHRLPLTQAIRQQILRRIPFPSALGGPFAAPLFAPLSAAGTLCGCAAQFYFRFCGLNIVTLFNYRFVFLSRTFFHELWKWLPSAMDCDRIKSNFSLSRSCAKCKIQNAKCKIMEKPEF